MLTVVVTIIIFLVLISLHEFGHFAMAKLSGVSVLEFSIGMGPAVFKKKKGETLYSIRVLPIGGYCKLEGEDEKSDNKRAFGNQKLWKRFLVIAAGAVLNILLGYVIFAVLVGMQDTLPKPRVQSIEERAYIAQTGIEPGDRIVSINGHRINFYQDISYYLSSVSEQEEVEITVKRGDEKLDFSFLPSYEETRIIYEEDGATEITRVNGVEEQVYVAYDEETAEIYADKAGTEEESARYILGFMPAVEEVTFKNVISEAYYYTIFVVKLVCDALGGLVTGSVGIDQLSGPVGVAAAVDTAVKTQYSFQNVLNLVAMLTINLGVFNLLPIPALDGGRILFLLIELIFRKPVPPDKEGLVHTIGMLLLLALAAVILFNDILKLI